MYKENIALNDQQGLTFYKTKPNQTWVFNSGKVTGLKVKILIQTCYTLLKIGISITFYPLTRYLI